MLLVDCGLFQGFKALRLKNWAPFPVAPGTIDAVILTHAHLDHSGYLPLLIKCGFRGPVYCSRAARDLCAILLPDAGHLQEKDAEFANRHGFSKHKPALPLYTLENACAALEHLTPIPFDQERTLPGGGTTRLRRSGHILGAGSVQLDWAGITTVFSGDLGRFDDPVMVDPMSVEPPTICGRVNLRRSTARRARSGRGAGGIVDGTIARGGTVIVPAFAVGRVQSLLFHLHQLKLKGSLSNVPIFLDSPMTLDASEIFCRDTEDHPRQHGSTARSAGLKAGEQNGVLVVGGKPSRYTANMCLFARRSEISTCCPPMPMRTRSCVGWAASRRRPE
jgi:metallo-beta-lactamase family protein